MASSSANSNDGDPPNPEDVWIYHERQEAALCGQHALNNLAQVPLFTVPQLAKIAHDLDVLERGVMESSSSSSSSLVQTPSANVDAAGNFSIQVLKSALQQAFDEMALPHLSVALRELKERKRGDITDLQGFVVHKSDHWFAIRQIGGRFWNLNSLAERPAAVSHFQLATEMERWRHDGYTVFAIADGLPEGGHKIDGLGEPKCWHRMSDLLRGRSTEADPWANLTGRGMRLDDTVNGVTTTTNGVGLSSGEDEELRMALAASLVEHESVAQREMLKGVVVPEEPPAGGPGTVRLRLRLPDGTRLVRRFRSTDAVQTIYALMLQRESASGGGGGGGGDGNGNGRLELRYGFPPQDMRDLMGMTIGDCGLAGESIQGRYV